MKLTKRQLRKIIKEELEAALIEGDISNPSPEDVVAHAEALKQSPAIQKLLAQLKQDPEIMGKVEAAIRETPMMNEVHEDPDTRLARGRMDTSQLTQAAYLKAGGSAMAIAGLLATNPNNAFSQQVLPDLAAYPGVAAIAGASGVGLMALGVLIALHILKRPTH